MTLNGHFVFNLFLARQLMGYVSGFRTKLFENLQSYSYTVSDKNVAHRERSLWQYKVYAFAEVPWGGGIIASNESVVVENGDFRFFRSLYLPNLHL